MNINIKGIIITAHGDPSMFATVNYMVQSMVKWWAS